MAGSRGRAARGAGRGACLALFVLLGAFACSSRPFAAADETPDAGLDAGADGPSATDPCLLDRPPPPPSVDDAPGTSLPPITLALTEGSLSFAGKPGFDLDGVCSCDTRPGVAHGGAESCVRPSASEARCDGEGGRDNAAADLLSGFSAFFDLAAKSSDTVASGGGNLVIQVLEYNGRANDKEVAFAALPSNGLFTQGCPGSKLERGHWSPGWCGDDPWSVSPESVVGSAKVPAVVARGYVADYRLVARVQGTITVPFSEGGRISFADPVFSGKLVPLGEDLKPRDAAQPGPVEGRAARLWALRDGVVAGRIPVQSLLAGIGATTASSDGGVGSQLCTQPAFQIVKASVCDAVDITRSAPLDFDPGARCDALSAAARIEALPAVVGEVAASKIEPGPCDPGPDGEPKDVKTASYRCP